MHESFFLIDITYSIMKRTEEPIIHLAGKDITSCSPFTMLIHGFRPYFYVEYDKKAERIISNNSIVKEWVITTKRGTWRDYRGGLVREVMKIIGKNPSKLPLVRRQFQREGISCFEFDILFVKRFLLDTGIRMLNTYSIEGISSAKTRQLALHYDENQEQFRRIDKTLSPIFLAFDLEVDLGNLTFSELVEKKERRITAISLAWGSENASLSKEAYILQKDSDEAERELITEFADKLISIAPDVIFGYNSDEFDFPYLIARMRKLRIERLDFSAYGKGWKLHRSSNERTFRLFGVAVTDLAKKAWGIHPPSGTKSLGDIAQYLLGETKIAVDDLGDLWRSGRFEELKEYCQKDAELTYRLAFPLGVPEWFEAVQIVGMPPSEGINTTARNLGEFEVFRTCKTKSVLIPPLPTKTEQKQRRIQKRKFPHEGALVLEPKGTLYTGVAIVDFTSMYPSLLVSFNIGGETLRPSSSDTTKIAPEEMFFEEPESCLAATMNQILDKRLEIKSLLRFASEKPISSPEHETLDRTQKALKIILNSTIGAHNYPGSRFFDGIIANAIFSLGRNQLQQINEYLKEYAKADAGEKTRVLYGDTDSAFVWFQKREFIEELYHSADTEGKKEKDEAINRVNKMLAFLNQRFPGIMRLELEDIAYRVIFQPGRRKAYAYVSALSQDLIIRGFEAVRSDWSLMAQETQKKVLDTLLREQVEGGKNVREAKEVVIEQALKILALPLEELKKMISILSPLRKAP
ncbi:MAG: DNA polymerase domain-containing protein, partial [Candidatus Hodarchaeales archaeon]